MSELELCREILQNFALSRAHCHEENGTIYFGAYEISPAQIDAPRIGGSITVPGWEVRLAVQQYDNDGILDIDVMEIGQYRSFTEALIIAVQGEAKRECERLLELSGITHDLEYEAFSKMGTVELAAYWNILQTPALRADDLHKMNRHESIVGELLSDRGVFLEKGKRLTQS